MDGSALAVSAYSFGCGHTSSGPPGGGDAVISDVWRVVRPQDGAQDVDESGADSSSSSDESAGSFDSVADFPTCESAGGAADSVTAAASSAAACLADSTAASVSGALAYGVSGALADGGRNETCVGSVCPVRGGSCDQFFEWEEGVCL